MRLLCLNILAGSQGQSFFDYLRAEAQSTQIFCFQEVFKTAAAVPASAIGRMAIYRELQELLRGHLGFFALTSINHDLENPVDFPVESGTSIFVKKDLQVLTESSEEIYGRRGSAVDPGQVNLPTVLQRLEVLMDGKKLSIFNYHGTAYPGNKLDTPDRLAEATKISAILQNTAGPKILCGDFNLMPQTQSIKILGTGMRNLIEEYKITGTRNKLSWAKFHNVQHFADYTFVSPDMEVKNFSVPYNEVSDHLPMILEF